MRKDIEICKAFYKSEKHRQTTDGKKKDIEISNAANGQESHLLLAVALSISMIFTSYAVSVLNHHDEDGMHAQTLTHRPFVVSYLA